MRSATVSQPSRPGLVTSSLAASDSAPHWMGVWLWAAGIYNVAWGAWVILDPHALFRWSDLPQPNYPQIWQCVGMIVGVYGVGYMIAACDPVRHWPIVLVGLLGKIFGPIGFLSAVLSGELPWKFGSTIITNDVIWWIPFGAILLYAASRRGTSAAADRPAP